MPRQPLRDLRASGLFLPAARRRLPTLARLSHPVLQGFMASEAAAALSTAAGLGIAKREGSRNKSLSDEGRERVDERPTDLSTLLGRQT